MRRTRWLGLAALAAAFLLAPASSLARAHLHRAPQSISRRAEPVRIPARRVAPSRPSKAVRRPSPKTPMQTQLGRTYRKVLGHPVKLVFVVMPR